MMDGYLRFVSWIVAVVFWIVATVHVFNGDIGAAGMCAFAAAVHVLLGLFGDEL